MAPLHWIQRAARGPIHWTTWLAFAVIGLLFLELPALTHLPARLVAGCAAWIGLAGGLELLSVIGFIVIFKLVFGAHLSWRRSIGAGLRALGASTVLPAGALVGPAMGVRATRTDRTPASVLARSTIAFTILTNAPGAIVIAALGVGLWLGWPPGPHGTLLTLPAAGAAVAVIAATWLLGRTRAQRRSEGAVRTRGVPLRAILAGTAVMRDGAAESRSLLRNADWKLLGAVGYYAFDNAVLWAAFRAYGHAPALSVIVMGYLVGSLASAIPVPAGLGVLDGGLIGALVLYGSPAAPAAAAVLLYRGISLSLPVALSAYSWVIRSSPARARSATPHGRAWPGSRRSRSAPRGAGSPVHSVARRARAGV